ncbi:MAG: tyrosine--tRNA ligase [Alphaproteobacteria bacterium]|nr:tyrosine--tRNA ligase [Alphaproteobacteria bacterium]
MNFVQELRWRGLLHDTIPGTEEKLATTTMRGYIGFDPTSDSLHIGSLIPIIILKHFQNYGHKPFVLVGGATGMVGDPSGKSEERNLLNKETLDHNLQSIQKQLAQFLNFDPTLSNAAEIVNNYEWFKDFSFLDFIRDIGKSISVNYMLAKDSVKKRLENEQGMSFTEFCYQLVQGYDFYWLYTNKNCSLQMGGSDQWGNIITGTELIRKKHGGEAYCLTCQLVTKADGGKFGKTEKGNIWLDPMKTNPFQFYQFWINTTDDDANKWIKYFTFLTENEIDTLCQDHALAPSQRILQKKLAEEVTLFVHGKHQLELALQTTEVLFNPNPHLILEASLEVFLYAVEGMPKYATQLSLPIPILDLLVETNLCTSKGEARKLIQNQGILINKQKIDLEKTHLEAADLLHGQYLLIQKGKKNHYLIQYPCQTK